MVAARWYPDPADILAIHEDIVQEYSDTSQGVRDPGAIDYATSHIQTQSGAIHQDAAELLRLLVLNHPFVDGNKRTAINTVAVFYRLNGYRLQFDDQIITIMKRLGTDADAVELTDIVAYFEANTSEFAVEEEVNQWRTDLVQFGLDRLEDPTD